MNTKENMPDVVRKVFRAEIKSVDSDNFTLEAVVSDETVDRYNEVILASAWAKGLKSYKAHPVLLSSHNYNNLTAQIGKAEKIWVEDNKLKAKFSYFVGEGNEQADWGFKLAEKGLAAFSVGFTAKEYTFEEDEIKELVSGKNKPSLVYKNVELLEVSQVLIPANPSALAKSIDSIEDPTIKNLFEEGRSMIITKNVDALTEIKEILLDIQAKIAYPPTKEVELVVTSVPDDIKDILTDIQIKLADLCEAIEIKQKDEEENIELASVLQELKNFETVLNKTSV